MNKIRQNWMLFGIALAIVSLGIISSLLFRLESSQIFQEYSPSNQITSACGQLPQFEFLHAYEPVNQSGGRFSFEKLDTFAWSRLSRLVGKSCCFI
jgi:hypothetical protein